MVISSKSADPRSSYSQRLGNVFTSADNPATTSRANSFSTGSMLLITGCIVFAFGDVTDEGRDDVAAKSITIDSCQAQRVYNASPIVRVDDATIVCVDPGMTVVGEGDLFRPKIHCRPPDSGVAATISTDYRKHGQTEFPIPSGTLDALSFAMRDERQIAKNLDGSPKIG